MDGWGWGDGIPVLFMYLFNERSMGLYGMQETISDLLMNRMDLSLLVVTKALSQEPEAYEVTAPHVELAKKMRKRDPATGECGWGYWYG